MHADLPFKGNLKPPHIGKHNFSMAQVTRALAIIRSSFTAISYPLLRP